MKQKLCKPCKCRIWIWNYENQHLWETLLSIFRTRRCIKWSVQHLKQFKVQALLHYGRRSLPIQAPKSWQNWRRFGSWSLSLNHGITLIWKILPFEFRCWREMSNSKIWSIWNDLLLLMAEHHNYNGSWLSIQVSESNEKGKEDMHSCSASIKRKGIWERLIPRFWMESSKSKIKQHKARVISHSYSAIQRKGKEITEFIAYGFKRIFEFKNLETKRKEDLPLMLG